MPEIVSTEYSPTPAQTQTSYCELAAYDAIVLKALIPDFVRGQIPSFASRVECDEGEARRALDAVLARPEVVQAEIEATKRWRATRPASADAALVRAWEIRRPPPIIRPMQWSKMQDADRKKWETHVLSWVATGPAPIVPDTLWARAVHYARAHPTSLVAVGVGLLVVVTGIIVAAGRRGPRRLPNVERELEERDYDRYDDRRGE